MSDNTLLTLSDQLTELAADGGRHLWVGQECPFDFTSVEIAGCTNFRLSPAHHRRYDTVWCIERNLASFEPGQFELICDELVRCVRERGRLILRYSQNDSVTVVAMKQFIGRRYQLRATVAAEYFQDEMFTTIFEIERLDTERYESSEWTFAVLTAGKRVDELEALFRSIRDQDPERRHEILVCGPELPQFEHYGLNYLSRGGYRDHLAEIARKKNDIADVARGENLCIVHDRYALNPGFFEGFESWGYDFDFCTVPQYYSCGTAFPSYCAIANSTIFWDRQVYMTDYSILLPRQYLNGGLLIAKTRTLRDVRFNDLCFWEQGEDVELAASFRGSGLPPRVNFLSSAVTLGVTPEKTAAIKLYTRGGSVPPPPAAPNLQPRQRVGLGKRIERKMRPLARKVRSFAR